MDKDTARQFAQAIANANGHPNPNEWAETVASNFSGEVSAPPLMTPEEVAAAVPPADVAIANASGMPPGAGLIEPEAPTA